MPKFRIDFTYEMGGSIEVEAKNIKQAKKKLEDDLLYCGLENLSNKETIENNYRELEVL